MICLAESPSLPVIPHLDTSDKVADVLARKNLLKITAKFTKLVFLTSKHLQNEGTDIAVVQSLFISLYCVDNEQLQADIENTQDFNKLFKLIMRLGVLSYQNYDLLETLIEEFVPNLSNEMVDYQEQYVGYKHVTNLAHHIAAAEAVLAKHEHPTPDLFSTLTTKVDIELSTKTVQYVDDLKKSLLGHFPLQPHQLFLINILKGCVAITWWFSQLETLLVIESVLTSSQFFSEHSIIQVTINNQVLYEHATVSIPPQVKIQFSAL